MRKDLRQHIQKLREMPAAEPSSLHLAVTIQAAHTAYASRRKMRHLGGFRSILCQLRFTARPVWLVQGLTLLGLSLFTLAARRSEQFVRDLPAFVSVLAVLVSMTPLLLYGRPQTYGMQELEATLRISHAKQLLAKLCAVGIGHVVCLAVLILLTVSTMVQPWQTILTFIFIPFLLSCVLQLFLQSHLRQHSRAVSAGVGIGLGAICWTLAGTPAPIFPSVGTALAICAVLLLLLCAQCRSLIRTHGQKAFSL